MVGRATELARPRSGDRALEIGAGSGYQTAILAELCAEVFAVEVHPQLASQAKLTLDRLGYKNVTIDTFDGSGGWPRHAPYDVIMVSAAAPRIPALLLAQLREGGRLVIPVGDGGNQILTCVHLRDGHYETITGTSCRYVDLVGRYGVGTTPPMV
jgi:protein-L-isoaspartate(D-aspartate) O-methyltransferase